MVRCAFAALVIAFLQKMIDATRVGVAFTILGGSCIASALLYHLELHKGMEWREKRRVSKDTNAAQQENMSVHSEREFEMIRRESA